MRTEVYQLIDLSPVLINPAFLGLLMTMLALGDVQWRKWLDRKYADKPRPITFISDRKAVTLDAENIAYIESNDTEVRVVTLDGQSYRNKTGISQWENLLGDGFLRIHRSYLVNKDAITRIDGDLLYVDDIELPISRKYKDSVVNNL